MLMLRPHTDRPVRSVRKAPAFLLVVLMLLSRVPAQAVASAPTGDGGETRATPAAGTRGLLPSNEAFSDVQAFALDADNDGNDDGIAVYYQVSTTAVRENVSVLIEVVDSTGRTVKSVREEVVAYIRGNQYQYYEFMAYFTGRYHIELTLYDSNDNEEDTHTTDTFLLDTGTYRQWITVSTTALDNDNDTFDDDVEVRVVNESDKDVPGAEVWVNGTLVGNTNSTGRLLRENLSRGYYSIDAFFGKMHDSEVWFSEGDGTSASWLLVSAEAQDYDGDGLSDDVLITVRNAMRLAVAGAQVSINSTYQGLTNAQGQITAFNLAHGWWVARASRLNQEGSARFFSEGLGPGAELDEYFYDAWTEVLDLDGDVRTNDLLVWFDVDVEPEANSTVTVRATLYNFPDFDVIREQNVTFTTRGYEVDPRSVTMKDLPYGIYDVRLLLRDSTNRTEDTQWLSVRVVRPSSHVNVETAVLDVDYWSSPDTPLMDDVFFRVYRVDEPVPNVTVTLYDTDGDEARTGKTNANGVLDFDVVTVGTYNWTAKDVNGRLLEEGKLVSGTRVNVETSLSDYNFDSFYDDFRIEAYNNLDRAVSTVLVNVWAPNGTRIARSEPTTDGTFTALNLSKGLYEFNATHLGIELCHGVFYSYGSGAEPFAVTPSMEAADADGDGRYDDMNLTAVDNDDGPIDGASVYVDGTLKGTTDINGSLQVKDIAWGLHQVRVVYGNVSGSGYFFSEGGSAHTASWTLLALGSNETGLDDMQDSGSSNDTIMLYFAEQTAALPSRSRLWIVLPGSAQEVQLHRSNSSMDDDGTYFLRQTGVIQSIVGYALGHFPGTSTAVVLQGSPFFGNRRGMWLEREFAETAKNLSQKWGLLAMEWRPWTVSSCYELRSTFSYTVGTLNDDELPLRSASSLVRSTPSTTPRELGEHLVGKVTGDSMDATSLVETSRMTAVGTAVDALASALASAFPKEGGAVQYARNLTEFGYIFMGGFSYASRLASELAKGLGTADLRTKATAMKTAVDAATLRVSDADFGIAIVFPNTTFAWRTPFMQTFINDSSLSNETHWDEFLEAFWEYRDYGLQVNATTFTADGDGRENDVRIYVNDTYSVPIAGANVSIDLRYRGDTDSAGYFKAYNFTRGAHIVNVTWRGLTAETFFVSVGTGTANDAPSVAIEQPEEDDAVNGTVPVRGNASDPDGVILYVDVRIDGGDWQRATGRESWTYRWDSTAVEDGEHLIEARSYDGDLYSPVVGVNVSVSNPQQRTDILLVVDDGNQGTEIYYEQALTANALRYDVYRVGMDEDGPTAKRMKEARYVIWFTGEMYHNTLNDNDLDALVEYLDSGGRLFLTGQDIGRDITRNGAVTSIFMRDYLKANYVADNSDNLTLIAVPGEYISEGQNLSIEGGSGARNQNYPDVISPRATAATVFLYNVSSEAGIKYGGSVYRVVYFGFGFEGIASVQDRNRIMGNVIDWLDRGETTTTNRAPVAEAGPSISGLVGETVELLGQATDSDGVIALFEWDLDGDGTYDWSSDATGTVEVVYEVDGEYTAKLRATDNLGEFATDTTRVVIMPLPPNQPPVPEAGEEVMVFQGQSVDFVAAGYDPDGIVELYEWDYEGDGEYDWFSMLPQVSSHVYTEPGAYDAVLRLTDDRGATATDTRTVLVRPIEENDPPTADAGPDKSALVGQQVTLEGKGTDPDGTIKMYRWDFDGNGVYDWSSETTGVATTYAYAGTFNARLLVIDNLDSTATDVARVTVTEPQVNTPPVADAGGTGMVESVVGEEVAFYGSGTDADGFIALYEWDFETDGEWDWSSNQQRTTYWTYTRAGLYVATLRVTDDDGATATDEVMVSVSSPEPPNVAPTADAGGPYSGKTGVSVRLVGTGSDSDGRVTGYEWDFESDGAWDYQSPSTGVATVIFADEGEYTATLRVTDDDGATATDTATITVARANDPPTVSITSPTPGQVLKGYVEFSGTASDDQGVVRVEVRVDNGAWEEAVGTTQWRFDYNADGQRAGAHTLRVRAVDSAGAYSTEALVEFDIEEKKKQDDSPGPGAFMALVAMAAIALVATGAARRRRGRA